MTQPLPRKLRKDGITEALLEIRFASAAVPEILIGMLASGPAWRNFIPKRLPIADIPAPIRQTDPNLQFQASLQLDSPDGLNACKIGDRVFSWHSLKAYPGWEKFRPQIDEALSYLFTSTSDFMVERIGFRYINLLNSDDHYVTDVTKLNITIEADGSPIYPPLNLNYQRFHGVEHSVMIRLASPEFVQGNLVPFAALVDIDVFTPDSYRTSTAQGALEWIDTAHDVLKEQFFPLLPKEAIERLREE